MSFVLLTDADLRELGLALGDRKRLLQAVAKLDEHGTREIFPAVVAPATASRPLTKMRFRTVANAASSP